MWNNGKKVMSRQDRPWACVKSGCSIVWWLWTWIHLLAYQWPIYCHPEIRDHDVRPQMSWCTSVWLCGGGSSSHRYCCEQHFKKLRIFGIWIRMERILTIQVNQLPLNHYWNLQWTNKWRVVGNLVPKKFQFSKCIKTRSKRVRKETKNCLLIMLVWLIIRLFLFDV